MHSWSWNVLFLLYLPHACKPGQTGVSWAYPGSYGNLGVHHSDRIYGDTIGDDSQEKHHYRAALPLGSNSYATMWPSARKSDRDVFKSQILHVPKPLTIDVVLSHGVFYPFVTQLQTFVTKQRHSVALRNVFCLVISMISGQGSLYAWCWVLL